MTAALELEHISHHFGALAALTDVTFRLEPRQIHALLGENGAGKSTLMKVAFGLLRPEQGTIRIGGKAVRLSDPNQARRLGLGMVHQHFTSIPAFTVAENVALTAGWAVPPREAAARVSRLALDTGLRLDPALPAGDLSAGLKQRLEILKALAGECRVLLLDEPTSVLSPPEVDGLLDLVRLLRERGVATVLITHKLSEALAVADRVTVLRRGQVAWTGITGETSAPALAAHMLGAGVPPRMDRSGSPSPVAGEERVTIRELAVLRIGASGSGLRQATLAVHAGEVVGVAAVEGNGQRELFRALAGLARPSNGTCRVAQPVAFIPEDRTSEAQVGEFTLTENLVLSQGDGAPWIRHGWVRWGEAKQRAQALIDAFEVRAPGPDARARSLSGGNQQRMIIAGALERRPAVLLAENPTRGLDLRATQEVKDRLRQAAEAGVAVLVHLADLDELLEVADRLVVLANGTLWEAPAGATRDELGRRMLGADWRP